MAMLNLCLTCQAITDSVREETNATGRPTGFPPNKLIWILSKYVHYFVKISANVYKS